MQAGSRFLGQIAVELGHLRPEELELALELQNRFRAAGKTYPLGDILLDRGFLTREQLDLAIARQRDGEADAAAMRVGDLIVSNGLATQAQVDECLAQQKQMYENQGKRVPLATLLLKKGYLDQQQKNALLRLQERLARAKGGGAAPPAERPAAAPPPVPPPAPRAREIGLKPLEEPAPLDLGSAFDDEDEPAAPAKPAATATLPPARAAASELGPAPRAIRPDSKVTTSGLAFQLFEDEKKCDHCGEIMLRSGTRCGQCDAKYCLDCRVHIGHVLVDYCPRCLLAHETHRSRKQVESAAAARAAAAKRQTRIALWVSIGVVALVGIVLAIAVLS
ncbi:MAG: hypothetical protein HY720_13395 [Planctomycetes bacterium]|nr:hypothetical protein [Planctomycetota bacterium]